MHTNRWANEKRLQILTYTSSHIFGFRFMNFKYFDILYTPSYTLIKNVGYSYFCKKKS